MRNATVVVVALVLSGAAQAQPGGGFGGSGRGFPGERVKVLHKFDHNGDGFLDAMERKPAREYLSTLPIHGEPRRQLDIGVIKIRQLAFPIGIFEFEEERPQRLRIVERLACRTPSHAWETAWAPVRRTTVPPC